MEIEIFKTKMPLDFLLNMVAPTILFFIIGICLLTYGIYKKNIEVFSLSKTVLFCSLPIMSTIAMYLIPICIITYVFIILPNQIWESLEQKIFKK